ncbi:MAG: hypothetical protein ACERIH_09930 [Labilibaculum antarcticum]
MAQKEDYQSVLDQLTAILAEKVSSPGMPVDIFAQEALNLSYYALSDKELLVAKGLHTESIDSLPVRVGAMQYAQSEWLAVSNSKSEAAKEWNEVSEQASALHRELLHDFRFAYRNERELKMLVDKIGVGNANADMIQDLSDMHALGKANPDQLVAINKDPSKLDLAAEYASTLGTLLAAANGVREDNDKPAKEMRDRAYTHLKEAVDEICEYGKYVFWEDEEKVEKYSSAYFRNLRKHKEKETKVSE